MITLYGIARSRAFRCLWMLEEAGVAYRMEKVSPFDGSSRTPEYLALNPNGRVPTLTDGGLVLWESMAINLYLAEKYGGALWPGTPETRASNPTRNASSIARRWTGWFRKPSISGTASIVWTFAREPASPARPSFPSPARPFRNLSSILGAM